VDLSGLIRLALKSDSKHLFVRADASSQIGFGHLMRCIALAQAWQARGGNVTFLSLCKSEGLRQRILNEEFEFVPVERAHPDPADFDTTVSTINDLPSNESGIILDGYHFDTEYQRKLKETGSSLLVIDDMAHLDHYVADIILNQNISAEDLSYSCEADTKLLLGTSYTLLRNEFLVYKDCKREIPEIARKILITMGGGDTDNVTLSALDALNLVHLEGLEIKVVIGARNPHLDALKKAIRKSRYAAELHENVSNMPELMAWADLSVSGAGSTCWELAFMGLPSLIVTLADNQAGIAEGLQNAGTAIHLGWHDKVSSIRVAEALKNVLLDPEKRSKMSERGRRLLDGKGRKRVLRSMRLGDVQMKPVQKPSGNSQNPGFATHSHKKQLCLSITFVSDKGSWINEYIPILISQLIHQGHEVSWRYDVSEIKRGDIVFYLGCEQLIPPDILSKNKHNLVVHESALPRGRGWSPLTWTILEGRNEIPITLFEAKEAVDSGCIYLQDVMRFKGTELVDELRKKQAEYTIELCLAFIREYPATAKKGREQKGRPTYYRRRHPADSRLDPDKTIRQQFNLLRVVDNNRYPAFFEIGGNRYVLKIEKA